MKSNQEELLLRAFQQMTDYDRRFTLAFAQQSAAENPRPKTHLRLLSTDATSQSTANKTSRVNVPGTARQKSKPSVAEVLTLSPLK